MQHVVYCLLFSLISVFTVNTQTNRTLHTDAEIQAYLDDIVNNKKFTSGYFYELYNDF